MELNRERKIYVGILGVAALALGVDRLVLSGELTAPLAAQADSLLSSANSVVTPRPGASSPVMSLAKHVESFRAPSSQTIDAFALPSIFASTPMTAETGGPSVAPASSPTVSRRLTAVSGLGSGRAIVRIDGKTYVVGERPSPDDPSALFVRELKRVDQTHVTAIVEDSSGTKSYLTYVLGGS